MGLRRKPSRPLPTAGAGAAAGPLRFSSLSDTSPLVLVVDDNQDMRAMLAASLGKRYRVQLAPGVAGAAFAVAVSCASTAYFTSAPLVASPSFCLIW